MLNLLDGAREFYAARALRDIAVAARDGSLAKYNIANDISEYCEEYCQAFGILLRDYILVAAVGEARHARHRSTHHLPDLPPGISRLDAGMSAIHYTPESIERECYKLFMLKWRKGYGGKNWAYAINALQMWKEVSRDTAIDYWMDLQHNAGTLFSKDGYGIVVNRTPYDLRNYLNDRRYQTDKEGTVKGYVKNPYASCSSQFKKLSKKVMPDMLILASGADDAFEIVTSYRPIEFGEEVLTPMVSNAG